LGGRDRRRELREQRLHGRSNGIRDLLHDDRRRGASRDATPNGSGSNAGRQPNQDIDVVRRTSVDDDVNARRRRVGPRRGTGFVTAPGGANGKPELLEWLAYPCKEGIDVVVLGRNGYLGHLLWGAGFCVNRRGVKNGKHKEQPTAAIAQE